MTSDPDKRGENGLVERTALGTFAPGNRAGVGHGRPPRARELAFLSATVDGCSPEQWTEVVAVVRKKALEGSAPHAALLARVLGLYREEPTQPVVEVGVNVGALLQAPGKVEEIDRLMAAVFAQPPAAGHVASPGP